MLDEPNAGGLISVKAIFQCMDGVYRPVSVRALFQCVYGLNGLLPFKALFQCVDMFPGLSTYHLGMNLVAMSI